MFKLLILFSLIFSACQYGPTVSEFSSEANSIVGGEPTSKAEYSSVVALVRNGDFHCSGVLISKDIVLTAAHCLVDVEISGLSIYFGNGVNKPSDRTFVRGQYHIARALIHPNLEYVEGLGLRNLGDYNANDVGIIFLEKPVLEYKPYNVLTSLKKLKDVLYEKVQTKVVGFGYTSEEDLSDSQFKKPDYGLKRKVDISIQNFDNHEVDIRDEGKDSCYIDSGGPVFVNVDGQEVVLALVSGSNGHCAENHFPVYYSLVFDSVCWIAKETGLEFEDLDDNCSRNQLIESKCEEFGREIAKTCAKNMSAVFFETQY